MAKPNRLQNKPEEDNNGLKGLPFEGVQCSLRCAQNPSDDVNKRNKLGKSDNKIDGGDKSNEDYVRGNEGSKKSSLEGSTDQGGHQGGGDPERLLCNIYWITPLAMETDNTSGPTQNNTDLTQNNQEQHETVP
eukprot:8700461-Ditylum_brightwellii.AAC.1